MEVILKKDVDNLGFEFEVLTVKPGYARNFLIPQGLAILATPKAKEELAKTLETRKAEEEKLIAQANEKSAKLQGVNVKLEAKVGSGSDKLFGSVNNADLAAVLKTAGVDIERKNIKIPGNTIKRLGSYVAKIRFHREVETDFEFEVVPDADSLAKAAAAAKAKAEVAKMDAQKAAAAAAASENDGFKFDNPLLEKKPEAPKAEELTETQAPEQDATTENA